MYCCVNIGVHPFMMLFVQIFPHLELSLEKRLILFVVDMLACTIHLTLS